MTQTAHTHRFDLDTAVCTRCGLTYEQVRSEREAQAMPVDRRTQARRELDAVTEVNMANERRANRRSYYERTGR